MAELVEVARSSAFVVDTLLNGLPRRGGIADLTAIVELADGTTI